MKEQSMPREAAILEEAEARAVEARGSGKARAVTPQREEESIPDKGAISEEAAMPTIPVQSRLSEKS
jgi:hypothetical protein